jgi:hypothetical protein
MAGRPATARGGGLSGVHIGLIAFAFVSVAALGGFIFQLTKVKSAEQAADQAQRRLSSYGTPPAYYQNEATARRTTVFGVMSDDLNKMAKLVAGEEAVAAALDQRANDLLAEINASKPDVVNPTDTLFTAIRALDSNLTGARQTIERQARQMETQRGTIDSLTRQVETARSTYEQQIAKTKGDYEQATAGFNRGLAEKDAQLAQMRSTLEAHERELQQVRRSADQDRREMELVNTRQANLITRLQDQVKDLKGTFDAEAILKKADGRILRAIPGSDIVYINLGADNNLKIGMPFEVYSQAGSFAKDPRGKASLEVLTLMPSTAECRVTRAVTGQPVMEGDIVVNLAYEQGRRPTFVIRGDFDLDFDGRIDVDGAANMAAIVRRWGGDVVPELNESVDFVVIGVAPNVPTFPAGTSDVVRDQAERRALEASRFRTLIDEARTLHIPVITQNQFLFLTGYTDSLGLR